MAQMHLMLVKLTSNMDYKGKSMDGSGQLTGHLIEFAKYLGGLLVLLSGWLMNRLFNRVATLEKESVNQKTFNSTLSTLREDNAKNVSALTDAINKVGDDYRNDTNHINARIDGIVDKK